MKFPVRRGGSESFVDWAVQKFGQLKPVIGLVHVLVYKEGARVFIASKQIYSNHYTEMAQPRMLETLKESLLGLRRNVEAARNEAAN